MNTHARTRTDHGEGSHVAAKKLNANKHRILNLQLRTVLRAVQRWPVRTAKELGLLMAKEDMGQFGWAWRRMSQLVELGYVWRIQLSGTREWICLITIPGWDKLEVENESI